MFLRKSIRSTNRILKEIAVFECENGKSFRARSHNLLIDFLNVSVLSDTVVYSAIPYEKIKAYMFLRRSLASLARAYKLHVVTVFTKRWDSVSVRENGDDVYDFVLCRYIWGLTPPPSPIPKSWSTLLLPAFAHQKSGQMKMADSVVPPPLPTRNTKSPPLRTINLCFAEFRRWFAYHFDQNFVKFSVLDPRIRGQGQTSEAKDKVKEQTLGPRTKPRTSLRAQGEDKAAQFVLEPRSVDPGGGGQGAVAPPIKIWGGGGASISFPPPQQKK